MATIQTMEEKFAHEIGDIFDAEHRFLDAMQEMRAQAKDPEVKRLLKEHIAETQGQIANLERVYAQLGRKPKRVKCPAAAGLVAEGEKCMEEASGSPAIRDCLIAGSSSKVEAYEIVSYKGLIAGAELMGQGEILGLLRANLEQEVAASQRVEAMTPTLLEKAMKTRVKKAPAPARVKAKAKDAAADQEGTASE